MVDLQDWLRHGEEMRRPLLVNPNLSKAKKIVIVGAGLSGMCCAYRIAEQRSDLEIVLVEKSSRLGGVIATWSDQEWLCDLAVNATRSHPAFWRLVNDLRLGDKFSQSNSKAKSRWILLNGKRHKLSVLSIFKFGPLKLRKAIKESKIGGRSVAETLPHKEIADALTLGIVNDTADNVDADFLFPTMTEFGPPAPVKKSKLRSLILKSYPLFTPRKGALASLEGGMETLISALRDKLVNMSNVEIVLDFEADSPTAVAQQFEVPLDSIIWSAPGWQDDYDTTELSIFAIGFTNQSVAHVKIGYGTLIPDKSIPISGILHESDIHYSKRSPRGHRLFRLMVPHNRWDKDEQSVLAWAKKLLGDKPVIFTKIGQRRIPRYKPGHMAKTAQKYPDYSIVGWTASGVSITHVVDQSERIAELF